MNFLSWPPLEGASSAAAALGAPIDIGQKVNSEAHLPIQRLLHLRQHPPLFAAAAQYKY